MTYATWVAAFAFIAINNVAIYLVVSKPCCVVSATNDVKPTAPVVVSSSTVSSHAFVKPRQTMTLPPPVRVLPCPVNPPHRSSEDGQDVWLLDRLFGNTCYGIFVEAGAYNGLNISNSLMFERDLGWHGFCVEPDPRNFAELVVNRPSCTNVRAALAEKSGGTAQFMPCRPERMHDAGSKLVGSKANPSAPFGQPYAVSLLALGDLLAAHGVSHVDLLSLDVEGAEMRALQGVDFDAVKIDVLLIEVNQFEDWEVVLGEYMRKRSFSFKGRISRDAVFVNNNSFNKTHP